MTAGYPGEDGRAGPFLPTHPHRFPAPVPGKDVAPPWARRVAMTFAVVVGIPFACGVALFLGSIPLGAAVALLGP